MVGEDKKKRLTDREFWEKTGYSKKIYKLKKNPALLKIENFNRISRQSLVKTPVKRSRCFLITHLIALRCVYKSDGQNFGEQNENGSERERS